MPWQQYVADVALEIDPDTGRLAYSEVGLTVPRQSGKSTLLLAKLVHRASATGFYGPRQSLVYTAQTRQKARKKWEDDYLAALQASRVFQGKVKPSFRGGDEHIRFANGSRFGIESNTEKAGHGDTLDEAYIDEAFSQQDGRLEQAFRPAMITRPNTQIWWVSTAGWLDGSPYLEPKTQRGREQAQMGMRSGLAYFEWSAPEDADPGDPEVWRACMPALGHTISIVDIQHEFDSLAGENKLNDFRRAYLNQWVPKDAPSQSVIPMEMWTDRIDTTSQIVGPVVFAVEMAPDRSRSVIAAAGRHDDGRTHVELAVYGHGTSWVLDELLTLSSAWDAQVVVDGASPAAAHIQAMIEAGLDVTVTNANAFPRACGSFYDAVVNDELVHLGDPELARVLPMAGKKTLSGGWAWDRRSGDISPLIAVTLAAYGVLLQPEAAPVPQVHDWPDEATIEAWEADDGATL
ncbi:MAG TPA: terminase family protein [Propionibacteriaceae bacterium]|jgi:phage terminase large subunit-like protein